MSSCLRILSCAFCAAKAFALLTPDRALATAPAQRSSPATRSSLPASAARRTAGGPSSAALRLEFRDGSLCVVSRADGRRTRLLDDLPEEAWRAVPAAAGTGDNGLFLHSSHPRAAPAFDTDLGALRCRRLLAGARLTRYWMGPAFGSDARDVPPETQ